MLLDPVILHKDGESKRIPLIDAPGWIAGGWSIKEFISESKENSPEILSGEPLLAVPLETPAEIPPESPPEKTPSTSKSAKGLGKDD